MDESGLIIFIGTESDNLVVTALCDRVVARIIVGKVLVVFSMDLNDFA